MTYVNMPGGAINGKKGGSRKLALAETVEIAGDKIIPTERFAKAQYELGKSAARALDNALRLNGQPASTPDVADIQDQRRSAFWSGICIAAICTVPVYEGTLALISWLVRR